MAHPLHLHCPPARSDPSSKIKAVVANIPVPDGGAAVKAFLDGLRTADGVLPAGLKGGRAVLLGNPMPPVCPDIVPEPSLSIPLDTRCTRATSSERPLEPSRVCLSTSGPSPPGRAR